ncbi:MAG: SDR family NAD(P)-dependent oxidoreductase [Proteobacteria bacterium]|nr:SDR family NAD(P)-dependent oxidoreductase [Pseudomonadota bacterium]
MSSTPQTVVITGAAGQLGGAVVAWFRQRGARLVLVDRSAERLGRLYGSGADLLPVEANLLDRAQVIERLGAALQRSGGADTLCHIAGGFHMGEPVHETPADAWELMMDLNARSLLHVAAAVVPCMLERQAGRIVTVGAAGALKGSAAMGAYAASKSALMRLTEAMSAELRDQGINVNCVLPSTLDTPPNRAAMPGADASRWVTPESLAEVIGFLASEAARAIHGAMIPVLGRV